MRFFLSGCFSFFLDAQFDRRINFLFFKGYTPTVDGQHPLGGRYPAATTTGYPGGPKSLHGYLYQQSGAPYFPGSYPAGRYDGHEHGYGTQYVATSRPFNKKK